MTKDTIAIFLTDNTNRPPYGDFADQSVQVLRKAGYTGELKVFDTVNQDYPNEQELSVIRAIWITGSVADAFANELWISKLGEYIQFIYRETSIPLVGICFGHQIVGRAFHAPVGRNPKGWEYGAYEVTVSDDPDVQELFLMSKFVIQESHQDVVYALPSDFKSIGSTASTTYQGFYEKDKILTFQGHPEFTKEFAKDLLDTKHAAGGFTDSQKEEFTRNLAEDQGVELTKVILKFAYV